MKTRPSQPPKSEHNELDAMSASDLTRDLKNMVKVLHPDILICRLIAALTNTRRRLRQICMDVAHDEAQGKDTLSKSQRSQKDRGYALEFQRVLALEHIVDLCLTEAQGPYVCRTQELDTLIRYAVAYINTSSLERQKNILKDLGFLRQRYERSIPYQIDKAAGDLSVLQTPEDVEKSLTLVYEENERYLASIFLDDESLGFAWESFIEFVGTLVTFCLRGVGFTSRQVLRQDLKDIQGFDKILNRLRYDRDRAQSRLESSPSVSSGMNGRLLFAHPIPSTTSGMVISAGLLCDSLTWYVYTYRKRSGAFRKRKGHLFEDRIVQTLETYSWRILAENLILPTPTLPNQSKAEYDIIAVKDRCMLIIEAKAYTPETRVSGYSEAKRSRLGTDFTRKLRSKAEFIGDNISEIQELSSAAGCDVLVPILLSTYPFVAESVSEGVAVLTEQELPELLMAPDTVADSVQIDLRGKHDR